MTGGGQEIGGRTGSYIGPPAAALGGAVIGGMALGPIGAQLGGAAGWLVGSWLFGAKPRDDQQIFDPGAQEMPRPNQALRGSTIPVGFGTNRWPSQIVWMKNWTVIRHESRESAGGGKGGGSGMGGKGGARGATNVSYDYKVDLIMHMGMAPEPISLFGGWLGGERLNGSTVAAIAGLVSEAQFLFQSAVTRPKNASLTFTDAFFAPAGETGGEYPNWDYFEAQEGSVVRWPHTAYVGFQQLNLGGSAAIPQLTWEAGPGAVDIDYGSGYLGRGTAGSDHDTPGQAPMVSANGTQFIVIDGGAGQAQEIMRVSDGVITDSISVAEFDTLATTAGLDPGSLYVAYPQGAFAIAGTKYCVLVGIDIEAFYSAFFFTVCEVSDAGVLTALGGYMGRATDFSTFDLRCGGLGGNRENSDFVYVVFNQPQGGSSPIRAGVLPSLTTMISSAVVQDTTNSFQDVTTVLTGLGQFFSTHQSKRTYRANFGFFLPVATIGAFGVTYSTYWYYYIGRADIQQHIDTPAAGDANSYIAGLTGTYPNGFLGRIRIDVAGSPEIVNSNFVSQDLGIAALPFDDACLEVDGDVNYQAEYEASPSCIKLTAEGAAGGYLIIFTKRFDGATDLAPTGDYIKVRAFIYNPFNQEAVQYAFALGSTHDTVTNIGVSEANRYTHTSYSGNVYYNEANSDIILHKQASYQGGPGQNHVFAKFGDLNIGGGSDVAPPYIIYHILSHPIFRAFNYTTADIDATSYGEAVQHCYDEGILVSALWMREEDALKVIELCLSLYGGYLTERDGKIYFGLAAFTSEAAGRVLDNDHLVQDDPDSPKPPVRVVVGGKQDTFNKVKINFLNRDLEYRQDFVEENDEVDQDLHGIRAHEFPPQFTMGKATATKLAVRTLWSNLYNRAIFTFKLGWKDSDLEPGGVHTLVDSFHPYLQTGKQVRLTHFKEQRRGVFEWQAVEHIPYYNAASTGVQSATQPGSNPLFGPALAPADFRMYELPQEFQGADSLLYVGYNQLNPAMGARLYVSAQSASGFARIDDAQPFIISGRMATDVPSDAGMLEDIPVYLMPASEFTVATPIFAQSYQLDDVDAAARGLGAGLLWVGSEMLAYEGVTLLAQNHYRFDKVYRGWGGTNIHNHTSGDYFHKHGGGMFTYTYNPDKIGTTIYYKVTPYNFNGLEYDVSSIAAKSYTIRGTYFRPQNQAPLSTFIESPLTGTNSDDLGPLSLRGVTSGGCDVIFTWPDASRSTGYGTGGFGALGFGHFTSDITSHHWRVEVLSGNASVVRSTTVSTMFFTYARATNSADFNGWNGGFALRVTPRNGYGDAIRSYTKTLSLFY